MAYNAATMAKKTKTADRNTITVNRKAQHDYTIEQRFEAGLALAGWEVKSLRAGRVQLKESHIIVKHGEVWLLGSHISPLDSTAKHTRPDPIRTRKLLLHRKEINTLIGQVERQGYTLVPLCLYWQRGRVKCEMALAKGKKLHDKRASSKDRDWQRDKERLMKHTR